MKIMGPSFNSRIKAAAVAATLSLSFAPTANAGDFWHGLHTLLGHHGTGYRASDYYRTPHRNYAPAFRSTRTMPTITTYAPYEPYVDGGSVVSQIPVAINRGHGPAMKRHHRRKHGLHHGKRMGYHGTGHGHLGYHGKSRARLVGVNRTTFSCIGYPGQPDSVNCVKKHTEFVPVSR